MIVITSLNLFTDLINTNGKIADGRKAIVNLPRERHAMGRTVLQPLSVAVAETQELD